MKADPDNPGCRALALRVDVPPDPRSRRLSNPQTWPLKRSDCDVVTMGSSSGNVTAHLCLLLLGGPHPLTSCSVVTGLPLAPVSPGHLNRQDEQMTKPSHKPNPTLARYTPDSDALDAIACLVSKARPDWSPVLVRSVLDAHAHQVDPSDLAVAAIRAAKTPTFMSPKTIGWRGPHWAGLDTMPVGLLTSRRCGVCGKFEDLCETTRIGVDDDHEFEPVEPRARHGVRLYPPIR